MDKVLALMEDIGRYLTLLKVTDFVDIAIIIFLVYKLLSLVKSTRAENILKGVAIFLLALGLSTALDLRAVKYILSHVVDWGILALVIIFQPELRRGLEQLGSKNIRLLRFLTPEQRSTELEKAIDQTVMACSEMSRTRTGVLMVFERNINLDDIVRTGTELDCEVVCELLKNIFFVKAPMHDGAVIVRHGRRLYAATVQECEPEPRPRYAPPCRYRHEREFRCCGGHRFRGNGLYLRSHRRYAQAAPDAGNTRQAAAQRADAA